MENSLKLTNKQKARLVTDYYWSVIRKYPKLLWGVGLSLPLTTIVNGYIPPLIIASIIQKVSQGQFSIDQFWPVFGPLLIIYAAIQLFGILTWRLVDYFMWRLEIRSLQDIAEDVFKHLLTRSSNFHANNFSGSLVSQSNKLLSSYVRMADTTVFQVIPMTVGIVATIIILLPKSPLYIAGLIFFTFIYIVSALVISEPVRRKAARSSTAESKQTGLLADAISNVMTIKSYARSDYERKRFHVATEKTRRLTFDFARQHQVQMNVFGVIGRAISIGALFLAVYVVLKYKADIGLVFLIVSYTATIAEHLFRFGNDSMRSYNRSFGDAGDMAYILSQQPEILDIEQPEPSRIKKGAISFESVHFNHRNAKSELFQGLELVIKPGEKIGLVGHSGSGKTTFTRLLMRFSDIQAGEICIDGQNIARISQDDLHRAIAYVPQEPLLFHRTLGENIAYGKPEASAAEIENAAKLANVTEFIDDMPEGFDTLVGERGVKLSGGQRQRIAIARAMLKDAPILVLDEATSALDSESEALIQKALWRLMEGRTTIAIAHRLSTIQQMDRIIVLDHGKIVEQGSHKELLERGGTYAKLWARQSGGFIEE